MLKHDCNHRNKNEGTQNNSIRGSNITYIPGLYQELEIEIEIEIEG